MQIALNVVYVALILYLFLLSLRIVLGWFAPQALGPAWRLLAGATDPYLNLFRRIRFLRGGLFDFSPIAAIVVLVVALDMVATLMFFGRLTLGYFLAAVFQAAWNGAKFLLLFFLIVGVVRAIPLLVRSIGGSAVWRVVDMIVQPVVLWVGRLFRLGPRTGYLPALGLTLGLLLVCLVLGWILVGQVVSLLQMIPV